MMSPLEALRVAVAEAKRGAGFVAPNPLVGCTILDCNFNLLSVGYHHAIGQGHAEVEALAKIGDRTQLNGAHVFVTLEPCAHEGRTPACAKTLAQLPLASVTYGLQDPNPLVAGQGAQIVSQAGIAVCDLSASTAVQFCEFFKNFHTSFVMNDEEFVHLQWQMEEVAEIFLHHMRTQMPFVAVKVAASLDGQIALRSGESKWITGEKAREQTHALRAQYDAVAVGRKTFEMDDPALNVRHPQFPNHVNRVVLIDPSGSSLSRLAKSKLLQAHPPENIIVVTAEDANLSAVNFPPVHDKTLLCVPRLADRSLDLTAALRLLYKHRVTSLFVEGGGHTIGQFLRQKLAHRLYLFQAPVILGAGGAVSWTQALSIASMSERLELKHVQQSQLGVDTLITGRF